MTDMPEFDLFPDGTLDAIAETMTPNTNFEIMVDGSTRMSYIYVINEADSEEGDRDARAAAQRIAQLLDVPQDDIVSSGYMVMKGY